MRPAMQIPDTHPGQELSDDQICLVFVLVAVTTMLSIGALIFLVSDAGMQLTEKLPCLPTQRPPPVRRPRGPPRAGTPRFLWESFGLHGLDHGLKEP